MAGQRSPRLPSSLHPLPDILLYNGLIFNIHFTNFSSPISFSVVSLFLYPSSCSSLPVRVAMQFHIQLLQSPCVGCIVGGFVGRLGWGECRAEGRSSRGVQPALAGQRSPRLPSSLHPLPDILLYNGLIFNIHFTNFSSPISFSVVSLFLYPSSCSSLPVRDAMQFHAQLIAAFLCGLPLSSVQLLVVSMCGLLCSSMFSCSSLLVWVAL